MERCAPSALVVVSRPEPTPVECSLATERRDARRPRAMQRRNTTVSSSNSSIALLLLLLLLDVVNGILNLETMPCFVQNLRTEVVGVWAKN